MSHIKELPYTMLKKECDPTRLGFNSTAELEPFDGIIGQDRAVEALEFGLKIQSRGYNIYMSGMTGTGKTSYSLKYIRSIAEKSKVPDDWCYVYNFDKQNHPMAINLPAGLGKIFQKDMCEFIKVLQTEIPKAFDSEDYEKEKSSIIKEYQERRNKLLDKLNEDAEKQGFKVKTTNAGIYFIPVIEGKTVNEQEYNQLEEKQKQEITERSNLLQLETVDIIRKIKNIEKEADKKIEEWDNETALFAVGLHISDLKEKYAEYEKVLLYLEKVQEDILKNVADFKEDETSEEQAQLLFPMFKKSDDSPAQKYEVNLFVDNSELRGAPVIVDFNPTYYNLLGRLDYENEFGTVSTDFTMIKCGLFHQANGGYLVLQAMDILNNVQSWEILKRILKTRQITIENMKEQMGLVTLSTLKPDPIPANMKVILVGSEYIYRVLYEFDEDFKKLFKIKADFDDEMLRNKCNMMKLARFITSFCKKENSLHFDNNAVAKIIEYSSRLIEDQTKITTRFSDIVEILCESSAWANISHSKVITDEHVKKAIFQKIYRSNKYDKKLLELIEDGTIMIDTQNSVVGQINALTVIDMGEYSFGKPSKITANTFIGESGIVNIEREVEMSGTSHTKGVLILSGYIGQKYAQDMPLSVTASLCFEQMYGGIDGDSASSAELYAILSSLAGVPIKQCYSVTGSVNQKGEIQPIGGVTYKIEGFFELCKYRGLDGTHGVLIPHQNVKNLVLNDDVIEAVKQGLFHIYPIKTIDDGIEILTGMKSGQKNENGSYNEGTLNKLVYDKLQHFANVVLSKEKEKNNKKS